MGFHVIFDILGSAVIGGILLMTLLNMKAANTENSFKYYGNQMLQTNLISLTEIMDNDFKQIGYAIDSSYSNPIQIATPTRIKFCTSIRPNQINQPDGLQDKIEYNYSGADNYTNNPKDTVLRRTITTSDPNFNQTGAVGDLNYGIVDFEFTYRDVTGAKITDLTNQLKRNSIYSIQVDITLQSTFIYSRSNVAIEDQYNNESVRWRRMFYPFKNRNNR